MAAAPAFSDFSKSFKKCLDHWKQSDTPQITVAWGDCDYLLHKSATSFKNFFLKNEDITYASYEGSEISPESMKVLTQSQGLFEPAGAFVFHRCEQAKDFVTSIKSIPKASSIQNQTLICLKGKIPAKLKKEFERLECNYIVCIKAKPRDIPTFINNLCKKQKLTLNRQAQNLLQSRLGDDLFQIENEILKLQLIFPDPQREITADDIAQNMGMMREDHAFKLTNLLLDRNSSEAQALASNLIKRGESAIAINGILSRHFRNAIQIGAALKDGATPYNISKKLRLPEFVVKNYNHYARNQSLRKIAAALALCQEADVKLKTSKSSHSDLIIGRIIASIS